MQLKLLGIAGTTSVSATAAAIRGLSQEEAVAALATTELSETEMAAALTKAGYTNATALETASLAVEVREQEAAAAATLESAAADTVATGTTTGLSVATAGLNTVLKGLWATLKANPFILVIAGVVALAAAIKAYENRAEAAAEKLSDSSEEVKSLQGEIDGLNGELKTTKDRIEELLRKPSLTVVEQNELERLQQTNDELERQLELKQRSAQVAQGKNADNFVNAVNTKQNEYGGNGWRFGYKNYGDTGTNPNKTKEHPNRPEANTTGENEKQKNMFKWRLEDYQEAEEKYQAALAEGNEQEAQKWKDRMDTLNTAMSGYVTDMTGYLEDLGDYDYDTLSDDAKAAVDYINDIQNAYLMATGDGGASVFSNIYNQGRFAEGKKAIEDLKESGKLTAETFQDLYNSNDNVKAMIDNMQEVGLINDTTAGTFTNLTNQILGVSDASEEVAQKKVSFSDLISTEGVQDTIDTFKDTLTYLSDTLNDYQSGDLTDSEMIELFEKFPELAGRTGDLDTALQELIDTTQQEVDNQFDSWEKNMPSDEDAESLNNVREAVLKLGSSASNLSAINAELDKLNDTLDDLQDTYSDIQGIIEDYNENGYYTLDNLQSLLSLEPEYLNLLVNENGQIDLNNQAYKDYIATKAKSMVLDQVKSLYATIMNMSLEEAQAYANAEAYQAETDSLMDLISAQTTFYLTQAKAKDTANNTTAYTDAIKQSFGTVANYAAIYDSWLNSLSTSTNEFTGKTNSAKEALEAQKDALEAEKDALEDYKDGLEDAKDALEDYKDELEDAQSSLQSLIDLTMDYIKQMKNDEKDALNDQIDALNDQKDALDDQKDTYADLIDKRKEALKLAKEEREEADELADKQKAVAKDALALAVAKLDNSSAGKKSQKVAADNLASSTKDLKDYLDERSYNKQVAALDEEQEKFEETIERRKELIDEQVAKIESAIDEIEKYLDNERKIYEDACAMIDNDNGTLYANLWNYTYTYTTKTRAEFDNLWLNAQAAIQRYKGDNDTLIGTMETLQQKIYDTDGEIADLNVQIDEAETQISDLDDAISATSDAISATSDSIDSVSSSLSGLGGTIADYMSQLSDLVAAANNLDLNTGGGDKTAFWVYHNGKKYETGYNYNGDTEGNRLLAAAELTKLIARDVSGFDNYGLGIVQGYLGVGNTKAKQWYYTFHGKTYTWTTQNQDTAIAQIASQVKKDYGGRMPAGAAVNKWTVQHYATGTYDSTGGLSVTQERGLEAIFGKLANGQYTLMNEGSHVFNADATNNLHKFMDDPQKFMSDYSQYIGTRMGDINDRVRNVTNKVVKYGGDVTIQSAPIYIQGNVDDTTLSKLDRQEKQRYEMFKKKFMAEMLKEL